MAPSRIENPTLIERFVKLIPLPYPLAALVWAAIIPSGPISYLTQYIASGPAPFSFPNAVLNLLLPFYLFYMSRYMRQKVVVSEAPIAARLSGGVEDYQRAFGRITQSLPALLIAAFAGTVILVAYASAGILPPIPSIILGNIIVVYLNSLAFSTYLWEFAVASFGLHRLGGSSLKLGPFLDDRMMGSKPMGNLALSLTIAYFGGLLFSTLLFSTFLPSSLLSDVMLVVFLLLGVVFFFLPLNSIHAKMQAEKRRLMLEVSARYPQLHQDSSLSQENATMDDVHRGLARLTDLQEVEMLDRKIAVLPTWPFDIQIVSRFITIVLSVTAVLLSRLITNFLHI